MSDRDERREQAQLDRIEAKENVLIAEDDRILELEHQILDRLAPRLAYIKIAIGGIMPVGPVTLTVGDKKTASVLGFDQNGAPFAIDFTANPVTWADDNEAAVADAPTTTIDPLTAIAAGVANIKATCAGFTDTETVTVVAAPPVLSSIKISFD